MLSGYPIYRLRVAGYSLLAKIFRKRCFGYRIIESHLRGKSGLEFGGPSSIFRANHLIPIYNIIRTVDLCNFAEETIWTKRNGHRRLGSWLGQIIIAEASGAQGIADESYDFVAASHVLEHVANPLRALREWKRIIKPLGTIVLVVPHKRGTFDHRRPFTSFVHIKEDFESSVVESDMSHLEEILELHDLELDPPAGSPDQFRERCLQNLSTRAMHHHVFSPELIVEMFNFVEMRILNVAVERPYHIIVLAQKPTQDNRESIHLENAKFSDASAEWRRRNPFDAPSTTRVNEDRNGLRF